VRLVIAVGALCLSACTSSDQVSFYCSPYLGVVSSSALDSLPDATRAATVVCPTGTMCVAKTPAGTVCGVQPDGSSAADACPSFSCASSD
jgi:hypothetical protein